MALRTAGAACEDVKQVMHELVLTLRRCSFIRGMFVVQLQGKIKQSKRNSEGTNDGLLLLALSLCQHAGKCWRTRNQ
jgi:hypothetical protein